MRLDKLGYLSGGILVLFLASCGGGSSGGSGDGSSQGQSSVSFGLSDAPVDGLSEVVITIDGMELRRRDGDNCDDPDNTECIVVDQFTDDGDLSATIQVDLLSLQGSDNKVIVDGINLPAGEYQQLTLSIIDEDLNFSWVKEIDNGDALKLLKVPSDQLKLGGFDVANGGEQVFVIEFDLRKAMTYNPGPDRYILKPTGVRIVEVETAASIAGAVATDLFNSLGDARCIEKANPNVGNVMYLYQGHNLDVDNLADNFDRTADNNVPENAIAPYTSQTVAADGRYEVAYLPAGDYTLAFSCDAANDDPALYDGLPIPAPANTIVELSLSEGESRTCDLLVEGEGCQP